MVEESKAGRQPATRKKQRGRLIKCICTAEGCGYTVRVTRKWIVDPGPPHCPVHGAMISIDDKNNEK